MSLAQLLSMSGSLQSQKSGSVAYHFLDPKKLHCSFLEQAPDSIRIELGRKAVVKEAFPPADSATGGNAPVPWLKVVFLLGLLFLCIGATGFN